MLRNSGDLCVGNRCIKNKMIHCNGQILYMEEKMKNKRSVCGEEYGVGYKQNITALTTDLST